jgi:hypothetical protein
MKQFLTFSLAAALCGQTAAFAAGRQANPGWLQSQTPQPAATQAGERSDRQTGTTAQPQAGGPSQTQRRPAPPGAGGLDLTDLGVQIAPEPRLIAVMAALDAAGWDPTPTGEKPSVFRDLIRRDASALAPELRARLQDFYKRNALKERADDPATPADESARPTAAEQAARYVSLAYALGPAPRFEAPPRSDELPAGVLEVLDFAPLVREFYAQVNFDEKLPNYISMYRAEGDRLRRPAAEMARAVLQYLNTRPETVIVEKVAAEAPAKAGDRKRADDKKKGARPATVTRERERRFVIVPELLAAPGAINFRNIGDDYFAVVPAGADPRLSELRRAYLQFVVDPLVVRHGREVAAKRDAIRQLVEGASKGRPASSDLFLTVARSLVAAADARMDETARLRALQIETSEALKRAADPAARDAALKSAKEREAAVKDSTVAQLAEAYERGAVLSLYFAEQLRDLEGSGFDVSNFVPAMIADFNAERELRRPAEYAESVARAREARRRAREARAAEAAAPADPKRAALVESLSAVETLLNAKNYEEAERRLLLLRAEHAEEPRVYFALGQAASVAAAAAFDEGLQARRLNEALGHYRQALLFASPETDRAVIARAHLASGRILAHFDRADEAAKEFDAAMAAAGVSERVHQEAAAEKKKLAGGQP